ncbi:MAG: vWA domain-containing protein, partial [Pseudomonadota bacterium]
MRYKLLLVGALAAACSFSGLSAHETIVRPPTRPRMEVVFVLDTTGSMSGMIAGAKQKIWAIANKLKSADPTPEIRFGLVGYRDRRDAYVTKVFGLTGNLDEVYSNLYSYAAEGGGDTPESVNEALHKAVRDLQWSTDPEVLRVIFLVGDAPPHMDYQDDVKYQKTCKLA